MASLINRVLRSTQRGSIVLARSRGISQKLSNVTIPSQHLSQLCIARNFHVTPWNKMIVPFNLADIGEGIQEVVIKEWFVKEGDRVAQFDNICEVQSDKASVTISSRYDGVVKKIHYETDDTAFVGKPLIDIDVESDDFGTVGAELQEREAIALSEESAEEQIELPKTTPKVLATPAVRRIGKEYQIDLSDVNGTGKDGRILKEDVLNYIEERDKPKTQLPRQEIVPPPPAEHPQPKIERKTVPKPVPVSEKDQTETIKGYRKAMVKSMTASMKIPHFGYSDEVNMTKLVEMRKDISSQLESYGLKFSFMPFFIKAASLALNNYPILNSTVDDQCESITYKASHNIGFAMDTNEGLAVPNIKGVQNLSILQISEELARLMDCGKRGSFATADVTGGTFTLSNIGSIGGTYTKPVIMSPQVAIGALGRTQKLPRFDEEGQVMAAHLMKVSWSADHRVIDGATMARFSNVWKNLLEKPATMVLYMK